MTASASPARRACCVPESGMRAMSESLREAVVGLVPPQFALEAALGGAVVDHDELGLGDLGEVAEHLASHRRGHHGVVGGAGGTTARSEAHPSELQSLMRNTY